MADGEDDPVDEPVVVPSPSPVDPPRRTNKAVIGLAIGMVILCAIIIYVVFFDKKKGVSNNRSFNQTRLPILNSRTISDNSGYGGSFNTNSAKNFRV